MLPAVKSEIIAALRTALTKALGADARSEVATHATLALERPKVAAHGDLACNIAMQLAKPLKKNPRELAQGIIDALGAGADAGGALGDAAGGEAGEDFAAEP